MSALVASYVFGSTARGDCDELSDMDLLAIVSGNGPIPEAEVLRHIPANVKNVSISWYGQQRIRQMYRDGDLFAWHLFYESYPVFEQEPFLPKLGRPSPYRRAMEDVESFSQVFEHSITELQEHPHNAVYELGIFYVCTRNIAMSASYFLSERPDFTRYSPYNLPFDLGLPVGKLFYETAMACRMASQRGYRIPLGVSSAAYQAVHCEISDWISRVRKAISREVGNAV